MFTVPGRRAAFPAFHVKLAHARGLFLCKGAKRGYKSQEISSKVKRQFGRKEVLPGVIGTGRMGAEASAKLK